MNSGSFDSYRSALSGTEADIGGEPEPEAEAPRATYHYDDNEREWVIRLHHSGGFDSLGAANGEFEAKLICEAINGRQALLNACYRAEHELLVWWKVRGSAATYEAIERLRAAQRIAGSPFAHANKGEGE